MRLLILGGTAFLGRAVVDAATDAGADVTLANRGRTNPGLYPDLENLVADRDEDLRCLRGRSFDAVIDTSGYFPRQVRSVVEALEGNIGHYSFVSSVDVYADQSVPGADEDGDLATVTDLSDEDSDDNYGGFKALCEATLDQILPSRSHHVRAGLIVGPHDGSGRFTYWVKRIAEGGVVLAPGPRNQPVQFIDAADLARWMLHAVDQHITGPINATGTPGSMTLETVLNDINAVTGEQAEFTWVDEDFLFENGVKPWNDLPLWLPPKAIPSHAGYLSRSNTKALELGLKLRPLADTVAAIKADLPLGDVPSEPAATKSAPGLESAEESELLANWQTARRQP